MSIHYCPVCASEDSTSVKDESPDRVTVFCSDSLHGPGGYEFKVSTTSTLSWSRSARMRLRAASVRAGWVVLPRGQTVREGLKGWLPSEMPESSIDEERLAVCELLGPESIVIGAPRSDDPDDLYVVFVYRKAIIAESPLVGNAAFVLERKPMHEWRRDLSLPKSEVPAERVIHGSRNIWKLQFRAAVDHGPPIASLLYSNGVPFDFESRREVYETLRPFTLPEDHIP